MATPPSSEQLTASEFTQQNMLSDLSQQRWLIGVGVALGFLLLLRMLRRPPEQEQAARRLVRDWRRVDDPNDARELLSTNIAPILRPALLIVLKEIEVQVHEAFDRLERSIRRL